jgi:hypothetical protein
MTGSTPSVPASWAMMKSSALVVRGWVLEE